jgi:hypothetical protein
MSRFINDDILVMFQKTIPTITEDVLKQKLCDAVRAHCDDFDYQDYLDNIECFSDDDDDKDPLPWGHAVSTLLNCSDRIRRDKDIDVDHENIMLGWSDWNVSYSGTSEPAEYLGIHTINNFTFCGITTGGDWEHPIFVILYWDGSDIRAYIPKRGNAVNMDTMTAFGSESDTLENLCWHTEDLLSERGKKILAKYKNLGIYTEESSDMYDDYFWSDLYVRQYGYKLDEEGYVDVPFNWEAMMSEIQECFTAV